MSGGMIGGGGSNPPTTTKGDISGFDTTFARVPVGADGTVLTADSTTALGIGYAAAAGGATVNNQEFILSSTFTTTSATFVDVTNFNLTISNNTGKFFCSVSSNCYNSSSGSANSLRLVDGSTNQDSFGFDQVSGNYTLGASFSYTGDNDGQVLKLQANADSGTLSVLGSGSRYSAHMDILEVS